MEFFTSYTDAVTGQTIKIPWTDEQIANRKARLAAMGLDKPPVPASVTRRQCALQMLAMSVITPQEALTMTKAGDVPAAVAAVFAQMPEDARIRAEIDFAVVNYYRDNSLLNLMGMTEEEVDQFFIAAAQL